MNWDDFHVKNPINFYFLAKFLGGVKKAKKQVGLVIQTPPRVKSSPTDIFAYLEIRRAA